MKENQTSDHINNHHFSGHDLVVRIGDTVFIAVRRSWLVGALMLFLLLCGFVAAVVIGPELAALRHR